MTWNPSEKMALQPTDSALILSQCACSNPGGPIDQMLRREGYMRPFSIFNDVLSSGMRGPSSSHTARPLHTGTLARALLAMPRLRRWRQPSSILRR